MWTTVLLLGISINLEPTRIGLVPWMLTRPKPKLQLLALWGASFSTTFGVGLFILLVFRQNPLAGIGVNAGIAQILLGVLILAASALLAIREVRQRFRKASQRQASIGEPAVSISPRDPSGQISGRLRAVLQRGRSPWFAGLIGIMTGLPSPDYLALLAIVLASRALIPEKIAALLAFHIVGSLILLLPILSLQIAPQQTNKVVTRMGAWTSSHGSEKYAALLMIVGCLLIGIGWHHL